MVSPSSTKTSLDNIDTVSGVHKEAITSSLESSGTYLVNYKSWKKCLGGDEIITFFFYPNPVMHSIDVWIDYSEQDSLQVQFYYGLLLW